MKTESYPRLRKAYAIISGVPDKQFNLRNIANSDNPHDCGTIACAAGWLAMHPDFTNLKLLYGEAGWWLDSPIANYSWTDILSREFCITKSEAELLFDSRYYSEWEYTTDKYAWLARVRKFLKEKEA